MSPLDSRRDVIVIGRHTINVLLRHCGSLEWRGSTQIGGSSPMSAQALGEALVIASGDQRKQAARPQRKRKIDVVLESAWSPTMFLQFESTTWTRGHAQALLKHRVEDLYGRLAGIKGDWVLDVDYRPGDQRAVGYAVSSSVLDAIKTSGERSQSVIASIQPALAWGLVHFRDRLQRHQRCAWAWLEQDRMLLGIWQKGRLICLNTGARLPGNQDELIRIVQRQALISGDDGGTGHILVGSWSPVPWLTGRSPGQSWQLSHHPVLTTSPPSTKFSVGLSPSGAS